MAPVTEGFAGRTILVRQGGQIIAGIRTKTLTFEGEPIDVTSDENDGWRTLLSVYGTRGLTASVEGVVKSHQLKIAALSQQVMSELTFTWPDGFEVVGNFALSNYTETGAYDDAATFSCELRSSGELSYDVGNNTLLLAPSAGPLPSPLEDAVFSQTFTASLGTGPYTYAVTGGALPTGLSLSTAGVLSGTPTVPGDYSFTITATDSAAAPANEGFAAYTMTVRAA